MSESDQFFVGTNDPPNLLRKFPGTPQGYVDAVDFIETLEGHLDGLYYLDGPEMSGEFARAVHKIRIGETP